MKKITLKPKMYINYIGSKKSIVLNEDNYLNCYYYCRDQIFSNYSQGRKVIYLFCRYDKKDLIKTISANFDLYKKQYFELLKIKAYFKHENCCVTYKKSSFYGISFDYNLSKINHLKSRYYFKLPLLIARNAHKTRDNLIDIFKSDKRNFTKR